MTDYKTLYDAIVNLNIPIEKQGKFANDKDLWFEYAHFPYIGKGNQSDAADLNIPLTFEAKVDNTKIYFVSNCLPYTCSIDISTDGGETWNEVASTSWGEGEETPIVTLNVGEKILVRGENSDGLSRIQAGSNYYAPAGLFWIRGEAYVYGNIMSLLSKDEYASLKSVPSYAFYNLFYGGDGYDGKPMNSLSLFSHPSKKLLLPATTLEQNCYYSMFYGCTSLTAAPDLPATTLVNNCYGYMFYGCTSLTAAPELPATTLADSCYTGMFEGCTSLTTAPELPATTLAHYCYGSMFYDCTSLVNVPDLPATTLVNSCYESMFRRCTSLVIAPKISATTLAKSCCNCMFTDCNSLTSVELPGIVLEERCYNSMFLRCSNLSYIKAMFTTTPSHAYTSTWVLGVSATGTFVKNENATWDVTGNEGVPTGWTVETA